MSIHDLVVLRDEADECVRCGLSETRTNVVFGVGNTKEPPIMFVGEAPGEKEDLEAEPFIGRAGNLLTKLINWMGYKRDDVYITNTVLCRPPGNRDPLPDEIEKCNRFLLWQITHVAPSVIVTLGRPATQTLLDTKTPISQLRGRWHEYKGIPLMPTFHPAYLMRSPSKMQEVYKDLTEVLEKVQQLRK